MADPEKLFRSFIAAPLSESIRENISKLQQQMRQRFPELKPAKTDTLHLTLHFLGDLTHQQLAETGQTMLSIGQKKKNFNVSVETLGCFPHRRRPRILWLALRPEHELQNLHQELARGLLNCGLEIDCRPFRPHLTIGRFRQPPASTEPLCPFLSHSCGSLKIDRLVLYTSRLTSQGAIHTPATEVKLMPST